VLAEIVFWAAPVSVVQCAFWLHISNVSPADTNGQSFYVELDKSRAKSNSTQHEKEEE
jgi:hypothetical protein